MNTDLHTIHAILRDYGFPEAVIQTESFLDQLEKDDYVKLIFAVTLSDGRKLVIKILNEVGSFNATQEIIEKQSRFSEAMRAQGILTPRRYKTGDVYCGQITFRGIPCRVTVEDYCGREIQFIDSHLAGEIGRLMARMHTLSLSNRLEIGCGTLFSAAYWNDVDAYDEFSSLCETDGIDQETVRQIKALREEKLSRIRAVWQTLPKCAVQGDVSINNLVFTDGVLQIFDYNNAGDEVLAGDMIMEGLLTAFEMDLPTGTPESCREQLFTDFVVGYLSVRPLTPPEQAIVWDIYTLWHSLWFTRIIYGEHSLEKRIGRGDIPAANRLLEQILRDMTAENTGLFVI